MYWNIWRRVTTDSSQAGNEQNIHQINMQFINTMDYYTAMGSMEQIHAKKSNKRNVGQISQI